jgi:hypothetical protein
MTYIRNINARHIQAGIRAHIMAKGADRVVIKRNGEVHAHGVMPGSIATGWYFAGTNWDILADIHRAVSVSDARA